MNFIFWVFLEQAEKNGTVCTNCEKLETAKRLKSKASTRVYKTSPLQFQPRKYSAEKTTATGYIKVCELLSKLTLTSKDHLPVALLLATYKKKEEGRTIPFLVGGVP